MSAPCARSQPEGVDRQSSTAAIQSHFIATLMPVTAAALYENLPLVQPAFHGVSTVYATIFQAGPSLAHTAQRTPESSPAFASLSPIA